MGYSLDIPRGTEEGLKEKVLSFRGQEQAGEVAVLSELRTRCYRTLARTRKLGGAEAVTDVHLSLCQNFNPCTTE